MNKAEAFYQAVYPHLKESKREVLVEACCGNGDAGVRFSGDYKKVVFLDIRTVRGLARNLSHPKFEFELHLEGIESFPMPKDAAIIAVHSCGGLTDKLLELAVLARAPVALMPCCYNPRMKEYALANPPDGRKLVYAHEKDYYDAFRMQYLIEKGFRVHKEEIDRRITPMNNVIIGIPR